MADIKIYGKLVANTEDQVVADASSIQDTARNQKLSVTLNELAQGTGLKVLDVNLNNYLSQDGLLALIQGINYATVGDAISYQFSSSIAVDSSYNSVHVIGSISGQGGIDLYLLKSINDKFSCETLVSDGYSSKYKTIQNATLITSGGYIRGIVVTNELVGNLCDLVNGRSELTTTKLSYWFPVGVLPTHIKLANDIIIDLQGNEYCAIGDETVDAEISNSVYLNVVRIDINGDFSSVSANDVKVVDFLWHHIENPNNFSFDDLPRFSDSSDVDDFPGSGGGGGSGGTGEPAFEDITVDLYYSDFDLSGSFPVISNQEKKNKLLSIIQKVDGNKLVQCSVNYPSITNPNNTDEELGGKYILNGTIITAFLPYVAFVSQYIHAPLANGTLTPTQIGFMMASTNNDLAIAMLFPGWYQDALFTQFASDSSKHFSLNFHAENDNATIGSSSSVGGSGKLYQYKFNLQAYDIDGNLVSFTVLGATNNITTLPITIQIYESNWEKVKAKLNNIAQMMGLTGSVNTPQDLVSVINSVMSETQPSSSAPGFSLLYYLVSLADKSDLILVLQDGGISVDMFFPIVSASFLGKLYIYDVAGSTYLNLGGLVQETGYEYIDGLNVNNSCTLTEYGTSASGGDTPSSESQYDYVQMCFNSSNNSHIILMFDKQFSRGADITPQVNQLITTLNQMGNVSIPAYTDLESLEDIADYLNLLDTQTYAQIKVIFWASVFSLYPYLCLTIKGYDNGMVVPVIVEGIADMSNQNFAYTIKMMDNTGAMVTRADEQTIFNFDVFVNDLD